MDFETLHKFRKKPVKRVEFEELPGI